MGIYDLEKEKHLGVAVLDVGFEADDHNSPVFYARSDGRILAFWAMHGKENKHYYSISDKDNYLVWSEKKVYTHNFERSGVTYMNLYQIENQGLLYNFFRDGPTYNPAFITSADNGDTWSKNSTHFIADEVKGRNRPYARYTQINNNRVGVSFTDGHPRRYGNSLYYAEFDGTDFYNVDGSKIKDLDDGALRTGEAEKIYTGSEVHDVKPEGYGSVPNAAWTCAIADDKHDHPHIAYTLYNSNIDNRFRLATWTGKEWNDREIAYAGECLYPREASYTGLMALDPDEPENIVISSDVAPSTGKSLGGKHEIYMANVKPNDNTETIDWQQITFNSSYKNIRPIIVSGDGYKVLLWLGGKPWRTFKDYESDVMGYVLERP